MVQKIAHHAAKDGWGLHDPLSCALARAGGFGRQSGNILRDVLVASRRAGLMSTSVQPYVLSLPGGKGDIQMFLPHEICWQVAADFGLPTWLLDPAEWSPLSFMGKIIRDWADHRDVQFAGDVRQVGPIGLHCDGASYGSNLRAGSDASIVVCSMNFIGCADPANKKRRHPLFVIPKAALCKCQDMCGGFHTYQAVFAVIAWSFRCMVDGHAPGTRHDDSPWSAHDRESRLARGVQLPCFALCQIRGDWAWYIEAFRFRSTSSCKFCFLCDAEKLEIWITRTSATRPRTDAR